MDEFWFVSPRYSGAQGHEVLLTAVLTDRSLWLLVIAAARKNLFRSCFRYDTHTYNFTRLRFEQGRLYEHLEVVTVRVVNHVAGTFQA